MRITILILVSVSLCWACNSKTPAKDKNPAGPSVRDSVNPGSKAETLVVSKYSSYSGVLPCPDCPGIKTTINLMSDNSYQKLTTNLLGKGKKKNLETLDETGRWLLRGQDTVYLLDIKDGPNLYLRRETYLIQLDQAGNRMTGPQADKYILQKVSN